MSDQPVSAEEAARHAAKKAKVKAARDKMMAEKTGEKGLVIVLTGPGMLGWQFVVADADGRRGLVARTAQQEFRLQEVAAD